MYGHAGRLKDLPLAQLGARVRNEMVTGERQFVFTVKLKADNQANLDRAFNLMYERVSREFPTQYVTEALHRKDRAWVGSRLAGIVFVRGKIQR